MTTRPLPVQFLVAWIATWMARHQERTIDYLKEENRVLREKLGGRVRLTDPERHRLATLGHELGRKGLRDVACIASSRTHFGLDRRPATESAAGIERARLGSRLTPGRRLRSRPDPAPGSRWIFAQGARGALRAQAE
jgi:hypothetical protein